LLNNKTETVLYLLIKKLEWVVPEKIHTPPKEEVCRGRGEKIVSDIRDRSLFMAGGGTEEKCFSWQKFC
jgi:hypothetical protein